MLFLKLLWRIWHVRNELTHNKPIIPVEASKKFLCSYMESLLLIKQHQEVDVLKGKQAVIFSGQASHKGARTTPVEIVNWIPPSCGVAKLNIDGSFVQADGTAGASMILRDHKGMVIYAVCRSLWNCSGALEAELAACDEGLRLALHWTQLPLQVETDCSEIIKLLNSSPTDRSSNMYQVTEIAEMAKERPVHFRKICRSQNNAAHAMAALGRSHQHTACWLANSPKEISIIISNDCKALVD